MPVAGALSVVLEILSLYPTVEPIVVNAITDFKSLFDNGNEPTQAEIDALLDKIKAQSAQIQAL